MQNLHTNTLSILKNVVSNFHRMSNTMEALTINIVKNITEGYQRFRNAHSIYKVMKKHIPEMIVI